MFINKTEFDLNILNFLKIHKIFILISLNQLLGLIKGKFYKFQRQKRTEDIYL